MIRSPLLTNIGGHINGRWALAASAQTIDVFNPLDGKLVIEVPDMNENAVQPAVDAAAEAMEEYTAPMRRWRWLVSIGEGMRKHESELARLITLEQGKPYRQSLEEVRYAAGCFGFIADQLKQVKQQQFASKREARRWAIQPRPIGVAALLPSWTNPIGDIARKLAPALAMGCGVVVKPDERSPVSAIALWNVIEMEELDIPQGLVNLVSGKAEGVYRAFCQSPEVRVITFTGTKKMAGLLREFTIDGSKRLILEVGGRIPCIVTEDADPALAAREIVTGRFLNSGQTLAGAHRVFVHRSLVGQIANEFARRVDALKTGDGMDPEVDIGPMITQLAFNRVRRLVSDAVERRAKPLIGRDALEKANEVVKRLVAERAKAPVPDREADEMEEAEQADEEKHSDEYGLFYHPTLLMDVRNDMQIISESALGPVLSVTTYENTDRLVASINQLDYRWLAYVFSRDQATLQRLSNQLRYQHIGINTASNIALDSAFAGDLALSDGPQALIPAMAEFAELQTIAGQ